MKNEHKHDGFLDALSDQLYSDQRRSRGFRKIVTFILLPIFFILCFFSYYFIFVASSWTAFASVGRAIFLAGIIVIVLLLSFEDLEWRLITIGATIIIISIDIMAQIIGLYEDMTILGDSLHYDFIAHLFGGFYITLLFTNLIANEDNKILFIVVNSLIIAVLWEVFELILYYVVDGFMDRSIDQFNFVVINSFSDLLAHGIGLTGALFGYLAYRWIRCPPNFRDGFMCRI